MDRIRHERIQSPRISPLREALIAIGALAAAHAGEAHAAPKKHAIAHEIVKTDAEAELARTLRPLAESNPHAFLEKARELGKKLPMGSVSTFVSNHPHLALENAELFRDVVEYSTIVNWVLRNMDVPSAALWVAQNPERMARAKKELMDSPKHANYRNAMIAYWDRYPSPDVAGLMLSFFFKHTGYGISWYDVMENIEEFKRADHLIKAYPMIRAFAAKDADFHYRTFSALAMNYSQNHRTNAILKRDAGEGTRQIAEESQKIGSAVKAWGDKFNVKNPLALARLSVLVARDLSMRGAKDSEEEVKTSLARIQKGQEAAASLDILKDRDFTTLVAGDSIVRLARVYGEEKDTRIHELLDLESHKRMLDLWQRANPGQAPGIIAVPFSESGEVSAADLSATKKKYLEYMASAGRARTISIASHGWTDSISLMGDPKLAPRKEAARDIAPAEFAEAHAARLAHPEVAAQYRAGKRDVYLFTQCRSFDFAKNVFKILKEKGVPLPIIIASADVGGSNLYVKPDANKPRDYFSHTISSNLYRGFGEIVKNAFSLAESGVYTPIVIFMPDDDERPLQVTELEKKRA